MSSLSNNLLINESYVETGSQPTATAGKTDLELVAKGSGISNSYTITSENDYDKVVKTISCTNVGLGFLCFFIGGGIIPLGFVGTYGARSHNKFCLTVYVGACVVIVFFLWAIGSGISGLGDLDRKYPEALQIGM